MKIVVAMASRLVAAVELSFYSGIKDGFGFDIKKIVAAVVSTIEADCGRGIKHGTGSGRGVNDALGTTWIDLVDKYIFRDFFS